LTTSATSEARIVPGPGTPSSRKKRLFLISVMLSAWPPLNSVRMAAAGLQPPCGEYSGTGEGMIVLALRSVHVRLFGSQAGMRPDRV